MVHGLSQGSQFGLSCSQGPAAVGLCRQLLLRVFRTLGKDLLQGKHVPLFFVRLGQELPKHIPTGKGVTDRHSEGSQQKKIKLWGGREENLQTPDLLDVKEEEDRF